MTPGNIENDLMIKYDWVYRLPLMKMFIIRKKDEFGLIDFDGTELIPCNFKMDKVQKYLDELYFNIDICNN